MPLSPDAFITLPFDLSLIARLADGLSPSVSPDNRRLQAVSPDSSSSSHGASSGSKGHRHGLHIASDDSRRLQAISPDSSPSSYGAGDGSKGQRRSLLIAGGTSFPSSSSYGEDGVARSLQGGVDSGVDSGVEGGLESGFKRGLEGGLEGDVEGASFDASSPSSASSSSSPSPSPSTASDSAPSSPSSSSSSSPSSSSFSGQTRQLMADGRAFPSSSPGDNRRLQLVDDVLICEITAVALSACWSDSNLIDALFSRFQLPYTVASLQVYICMIWIDRYK